jgi:trehalose 6-phosphate phosphatase
MTTRRSARSRPPVIALREFDALLFDLDGVVTRTAAVHAAAWKRLFDEYLRRRADRTGESFRPFDVDTDYLTFVDGKPRYDGVRSFLESRGVALPEGTPEDEPGEETVCGLGNRKNMYFREQLRAGGAEVFDTTVHLIRAAREHGLKTAVVSSSKNCAEVLDAAGLADLFDTRVDGVELERLGLPGKPAPDMFLEAARRLGAEPGRAVVFEDAVSGVQAGRAGAFGLVVGVDRSGQADALREAGADIVISDLGELELAPPAGPAAQTPAMPSALERFSEIADAFRGRRPAVFLDYDGTLTPIVDRPDLAVLSPDMRETIERLARLCPVAIVSGRDRPDVEALVKIDELVYAGSHGFDIAGPDELSMQHEEAARYLASLRQADDELRRRVGGIDGVLIEAKKYALAVHYRLVAAEHMEAVRRAVEDVAADHHDLRMTGGKKVVELRPRLDWDKGKAVLWLREVLGLDGPDVVSFYLGDDETDEDAFAALRDLGIGILVAERPHATLARYRLRDPGEVAMFLGSLIETLEAARA